jgi:uncharacterized radical SAM superfamily protein
MSTLLLVVVMTLPVYNPFVEYPPPRLDASVKLLLNARYAVEDSELVDTKYEPLP